MMEEDFKQLHLYIGQQNFKDAEISLRCMQNISEKEYHETAIDEYILNAFDDNHGLLKFILNVRNQTKFSGALAEGLEVLHVLVKELTKKIIKYVPDIREVCLKVVLTDKPKSKAKVRALELLSLILEKTDNFSNNQQIKELYETLYNCYKSNLNDKQMGVLALIIKTLYTLIRKYYAQLNSIDMLCKEIFSWLCRNCTRSEGVAVIEQSFRFFDHYLFLNNDFNDSQRLYDCVIQRLRSNCGSHKSSHVAALEILQHHSFLYQENIFEIKYTLENSLMDYLKQSGDIQKAAYYTLDAFYQTLGAISSTKSDSETSKFWIEVCVHSLHRELAGDVLTFSSISTPGISPTIDTIIIYAAKFVFLVFITVWLSIGVSIIRDRYLIINSACLDMNSIVIFFGLFPELLSTLSIPKLALIIYFFVIFFWCFAGSLYTLNSFIWSLQEEYPKLAKLKILISSIFCVGCFLVNLTILRSNIENLYEAWIHSTCIVAKVALLFFTLLGIFLYTLNRIANDYHFTYGQKLHPLWLHGTKVAMLSIMVIVVLRLTFTPVITRLEDVVIILSVTLPTIIGAIIVIVRYKTGIYLDKFINDINNEEKHGYELRLSIRGFGYFAKCFKIHLEEAVITVFLNVILKIEKMYLLDFDKNSTQLTYLPDYVQTLSKIVEQLDSLSRHDIVVLQKITILLIRLSPYLSAHHPDFVVKPILIAFSLARKCSKNVAKGFLQNVIYEGIVFSCSHQIAYDLNDAEVTYKDYINLWINLVNKNAEDGENEKNLEEIFDELIITLFCLLSKLNLNIQQVESYEMDNVAKISFEAVKVPDFNIFVNMVDLYVEILKAAPINKFSKCVKKYLDFIITESKKSPLISGFYKLIAIGLQLSNKLHYFSSERLQRNDIRSYYDIIQDFINTILIKIESYKDDLKLSCLKVVLAAPEVYVKQYLNRLSPAIISLFISSRSNLTLAMSGIDTLELWNKFIPQKGYDDFLMEIVPTFDSYLRSKPLSENIDTSHIKQRKTKQALYRRKITSVSEGDLLQLQKKILSFLGNVNENVLRSLTENNNKIDEIKSIIDDNLSIKIDLNFDTTISIYIEKFIPRVIDLALNCSERKLQITACETLHAFVIVFLGTSRVDDQKNLDDQFKKMFYPLLQLGCFPDDTVQQIIKPLVEQLIHWFSSPNQRNSPKLAILIESLLEAITQKDDISLRDFSCHCIHEFIKYSLKHLDQTEEEYSNVKVVIRKIKLFCYHSNPLKRLAGSLIFNNIYTLLREENFIVETYWLVLFQSLIYNLSQIEENDDDSLLHTIKSIDHLERVFKEKSMVFNKPSRKRKIPVGFLDETLNSVVTATLNYRNARNRQAKIRIYQFYYQISPLTSNESNQISFPPYIITNSSIIKSKNNNFSSGHVMIFLKKLLHILDTELSIYEHEKSKHLYEIDQNLLEELKFYFEFIYPYNLNTINPKKSNVTHLDDMEFKRLNFEVLKNSIQYLIISSFYENNVLIEELMKIYAIKLLSRFIFRDFNEKDELSDEEILNLLKKIVKDEQSKLLTMEINEIVSKNNFNPLIQIFNVTRKEKNFLKGLKILIKIDFLPSLQIETYLKDILIKTFDNLKHKDSIKLNIYAKNYYQSIIELNPIENIEYLLKCLCETNEIFDVDKNETTTFGLFFYNNFKETLLPIILPYFQTLLDMVKFNNESYLYFTKEIIKYSVVNKTKRTFCQLSGKIAEIILSNWNNYCFNVNDLKNASDGLQTLESIIELINEDFELSSDNVINWIFSTFNLLDSPILPQRLYRFIEELLSVLPLIIKFKKFEMFKHKLEMVKNDYFIDVKEIEDSVTLAINKSFQISITSKFQELFMFSCELYTTSNLKENINIEEYIKFFMISISNELQLETLKNIFKYFTSLKLLKSFDLIITNLLRYSTYDVFEKFYVEYIKDILLLLEKNDDIEKSIGFILIKCLFSRIDKKQLEEKNSPIITASNIELIKFLFKTSTDYLKETPENESSRISKCHCYNSLISVVSNGIPSDLRKLFYDKLFFRGENENILWRNLIDLSNTYVFPILFDKLPAQTTRLVNIRTKTQTLQDNRYIESQTLYNSTLCEDFRRYDFTKVIIRSQQDTQQFPNESEEIEMKITIESDELNNHECIPYIRGLIKRIYEDQVYENHPKWVELINTDLKNQKNHVNVKLFLLKIIESEQEIFKDFSKLLTPTIINLIVDKTVGNEINYFIGDLIIMLTSWGNFDFETNPETSTAVSNLVLFLMINTNRDRYDIKKYHLNLLKLVVETWKKHIKVPEDFIFNELEKLINTQSKKVEVIVHFCSIFLANDIEPWGNNLKKFVTIIVNSLQSTQKSIQKTCSQTIGMALKLAEKNQNPDFNKFKDAILKKVKDFNLDNYLGCLQGFLKSYPEICDHLLNKLLLEFNKTPESKRVSLLVFSERTKALNSHQNFQILNFDQLINDYDDGLKLLGMKIILKSIPKIKIENDKNKFISFMNNLSKLLNNNNKDCRNSMYDIFIEINKLINDGDIKKISLDFLLQGLNDPEDEIQTKLIEFFLEKLPNDNISKKFLSILNEMYKPELEDRFLSYSIVLLLNNLDTSTLLFNTPLQNADFSERNITDNWRGRHSSLAPLFASTYRSQESTTSGNSENSRGRSIYLKATAMEMEFEPTYQPENIYEKHEINDSEEDEIDFKVPLVPLEKKVWKQRFQKDFSKTERGFALGQLHKKEKMGKKRIDDLKQRQEKAVIYRKYRDGEIPDIEICLVDLIVPLKKLIQHDYHMADIFYTSFFKDILKKNSDDQNFISTITNTINKIFKSSINYNSYFMSSLLNVILKIPGHSFSPETITTVASNSGLISSGILILEEYLISQIDDIEIETKRKPSSNSKLKIWVNLADLYREIKEWDTVKAIFVQKMDCDNTVLKAIDYESKGEWRGAEELYVELLQKDPCVQRKDFYYESFFKCYAEMSKWEDMTQAIKNATSDNVWDDLWDNDFNQRKLLPWYISAELRNGIQNANKQKELIDHLNNSMMNSEKAIYLKQHFSEELGFIHLINKNYDKALYYIKYNLEKFLEDWQNTSSMLVTLRTNMLMKIVNSIDLFNFINDDRKQIGERWRKSYEINSVSIVPLESRHIYRSKCLSVNKYLFADSIKLDLDINLIENAVNMKNFYVARKYYRKIQGNNSIRFQLAYAKMLMLRSSFHQPKDSYRFLEESYRVINEIETDNIHFDLKLSTFRILCDLLFDFAKNANQFKSELTTLIPDLTDCSEKTVKEYGVKKFRKILDDYNNRCSNWKLIGDSYVKLAIFYKSYEDTENYLICVLKSMYFISGEGRQMFPCLLDIKNIEKYKETFLKLSEKIPIWIFIQWIPQLLSKIDTNCIFVIDKIILKIAKSYPQSIMYPYKLTKEKIDLNNLNDDIKKKLNDLLNELDDLLSNENVDDLIEALSNIVSPKNVITSYIMDLLHSCYLKDENLFKSHIKKIKTISIKTDTGDPLSKIGLVQKHIIELTKDLIKLENEKFNPEKLIEQLHLLKSNIKEKKHLKTLTLSYYSPYLSFFMDNQEDIELEIPGQYKNEEPFPQYHVKIAGFSPEILTMESKRSPIRIKIIGNDGKEYPFLVKVGEDLRQDQRIEQMFTLMNQIFNSNATCRERRLKISTYQVIPLTKSLGLIEWVENTIPLRKFLSNNHKMLNKQLENIQITHRNRYSRPENYPKALIKHNPDVAINLYRELVNKIPMDLFRKALWSLSVDSESFISIRTTFITSYISTCIANWILGIGDRHLDNTLICLNSARTIDIDFGHAFGVGVQIQSIPELVPFRLTPHIVNLMQPLEEHGLIEQSMIHILRALRENENSLISTVKVFINEPSMDWIQYKKFENFDLGYNWCGEEKIRHVEMKLNGSNSVEIMIEELKKRKDDMQIIEKYVEYVRGYERNVRSGLNGLLSVEDQVKCLLDHATDPNLLCRMFSGWAPWV